MRRRPIPPSDSVRFLRACAVVFAAVAAVAASAMIIEATARSGFMAWNVIQATLIFVTTAWLAWGATLAIVGLWPRRTPVPELTGAQPPTVVIVPICKEDPLETFARIAAIDKSIDAAGIRTDIAILSDTTDPEAALHERRTVERLRREMTGQGRIFYRQRTDNRGRKAGNIEEFFRRSGGAYDYAVILDADSLVEGATIRRMIASMQADPDLGLLQSLPKVVGARSFFARAMQFSSWMHGPVFTRGLVRMQGATGPFWGHNAIVRVRAFAESCGLPELSGPPPFGGHILSHDYVEAALLARAGWKVQADETIGGSYEEGPENVLSYAKRDRRWCQGNLQHMRLLLAPGFAGWSRFVFLQGILAYLVSLFWAGFLLVSVLSTVLAPMPDYFPDPYQLFPVFPSDRSRELTALAVGVVGLLVLPKFAVWIEAVLTRRVVGFGGMLRSLASILAEILATSLLAPIMLMFQTRAVLQILSGQDAGWPANSRGEGALSVAQSFRATAWISVTGAVALALSLWFAPVLAPWLLPVTVPMIAAPLLIALTSRRLTAHLFSTPAELEVPSVVESYLNIRSRWRASEEEAAGPDLGGQADVAA